jgi:hypothetical protein
MYSEVQEDSKILRINYQVPANINLFNSKKIKKVSLVQAQKISELFKQRLDQINIKNDRYLMMH